MTCIPAQHITVMDAIASSVSDGTFCQCCLIQCHRCAVCCAMHLYDRVQCKQHFPVAAVVDWLAWMSSLSAMTYASVI